MKKNRFLNMIVAMLVILLFAIVCFAENPVVQTNFTADPAPMVYNDTVFLYTGHDEDSATNFAMYDYLLYTSTDLVNWRDRGVIASTKSFKWASANGAWASQCIYRNGKFYYYCAMNQKGIGVLVSNSPYGPFTDTLKKALVNHSGSDIDPTVFIDDDAQAYMYWGNPQAFFVKLNQDMISYSGKIDSVVPKLSTYQEGAVVLQAERTLLFVMVVDLLSRRHWIRNEHKPYRPLDIQGFNYGRKLQFFRESAGDI